eukprot:COSAG01_NODE_44468_length_418_cov_65.156740_2_plen_66_part_01
MVALECYTVPQYYGAFHRVAQAVEFKTAKQLQRSEISPCAPNVSSTCVTSSLCAQDAIYFKKGAKL